MLVASDNTYGMWVLGGGGKGREGTGGGGRGRAEGLGQRPRPDADEEGSSSERRSLARMEAHVLCAAQVVWEEATWVRPFVRPPTTAFQPTF